VKRLTFYYPVAVGGPIAAIMDGFCKVYLEETGVAVEPVYAGDYSQTLIKAVTRSVPGQAAIRPYCWQPRCTVSKIRTSCFAG